MPPNTIASTITSSTDNPEPNLTSTSVFDERSSTGTQFFSGYIRGEEYLPELEGLSGIEVFDRMRRQDAQVRSTLASISLPIRQANWFVDPVSDAPADVEIAGILQKNLLEEMSITWDDFIRQALTFLVFGHSVFEECYEYRDGLILLKKMAPRLQRTIWKWYRNTKGEFSKITQHVQMPNSSQFEYRDIEAAKLTVFVNEQEGDNYAGTSILRSAYKHWFIKDNLYKCDAIGHDRFASGIPWMKEPMTGGNPTDIDRAKQILADLHSRERSYMIIPKGWESGIFERTAGSNSPILESIKHHNEEIAKNILAQFINLGTTETGSRALSDSFIEMFLMSVNAVAGYICDVINRKVLRQIVDYNWNVTEYPRLKCSRITLSNVQTMLGLTQGIQSGLITKDIDIENQARELLGLPKMKEGAEVAVTVKPPTEPKEPDDTEDDTEDDDEPKKPTVKAHDKCTCLADKKPVKRSRALSDCETALADFDTIERHLDDGGEHYRNQIMKVRIQQIDKLAKDLLTVKPTELKPAYVGKLADRIYDEMVKAYRNGTKDVQDELLRQAQVGRVKLADRKKKAPDLKDYDDEADILKFFKSKAEADAVGMSNKLVSSGLSAYYGLAAGLSNEQKIESVTSSLMDLTQDVNQYATGAVNISYGMGRDAAGQEYTDSIEYAVYSAILDGNTCNNCLAKDGVKHEMDDTEFDTPNDSCEGTAARCRCVNIYKLEGMEGDFVTKPKEDYIRDIDRIERGEYTVGNARDRYGM